MGKLGLTTARALVKFLDNQYLEVDGVELKFVKDIFAILDHGNVLGLGQVLEQGSDDICVYQGRNEQGMAHAAIGLARQVPCWQITACTSLIGPGATNMIIAAGIASANRTLLLLLPDDVFATRQPDPVLQRIGQSYDLSISTNDVFRAVSKYWDRITRPEQLMSACINAMRILTDPAGTGAVTLCSPQDAQGEAWDYLESLFARRVHRLDRRPASVAQLADAIAAIKASCKSLIVCGGGMKYSGADEALSRFAERYGMPLVETQVGKGTVVSSHPLNVGDVGETGCLAASLLVKEADLMIGVGTRFSDFTTTSEWIFQHPEVRLLNINVSNLDAWKLDDIIMLADVREVMTALDTGSAGSGWQAGWGAQIENVQSRQLKETQCVYQAVWQEKPFVLEIDDHLDRESMYRKSRQITDSTLTQNSVLGVLNETLPAEAVIAAVTGSLPGDLQHVWCNRAENTYHVEYDYSCMGYEVNVALGVKLAQSQGEVYSLVGGGSFMMLHSELVTSLQERAKVNVVLFDNMANGCINNLQMEHGMDSFGIEFRYRQPETGQLQGGLVPMDFTTTTAGYGCKTWRVTALDELRHALDVARCGTVSTLTNIKVLLETVMHKHGSWWNVGVTQTALSGRIRKVAQMVNEKHAQARDY